MHIRGMLEFSKFYGIAISMSYADNVRPHFFARCAGELIAVEIDGNGVRGSFPPCRLPMLFEWRQAHHKELRANWELVSRGEEPEPIAPLQ